MRYSAIFRGFVAAVAVCVPLGSQAGNIPQYSFEQTHPGFEYLTDATPVRVSFNDGSDMVFQERQTNTAFTGQGFPIGFDFRYGGQIFNQFAIDNNGNLLFGKDKVEFHGYASLFYKDTSLYSPNYFYLGFSPAMYGIKSGEINYKLEGEAGNRTMTVEFAHMNVREPALRGNAIYSMQIVIYEKDGQIDINFIEEESPYNGFCLMCGLYGWSLDDDMIITASDINATARVSKEHEPDILIPNTVIRWNNEDILDPDDPEGHAEPYNFTYTFKPTGTADFVSDQPTDLTVEQTGNNMIVSCTRPANAPATVIMVSESPILEFPTQGVTYPVIDNEGNYVTKIGGATMIYYGNDEVAQAVYPDVKASTPYYVKAFGVNGYPSYSTDTSADLEFVSSHPAPYVMQASSAKGAINIKTIGDDDVIIAATLDRVTLSNLGATGIFGMPEADCAVGDALEGGGEIIYIGAPGEFSYTDATPNRQTFFRAWALREGRVSKPYINATGVTNAEMPFEPQVELFTLYEIPLGWISTTTSTSANAITCFIPRMRGEKEDEPAVAGYSESGSVATLTTPVLNHGENAKLNFEWAMETCREVDQGDALVVLPEGNEPGVFGTGHSFKVIYTARGNEESEIFKTSEYNGTMTASPNDPDHYISGTSTFQPVEVNLPTAQKYGTVTFSFSTEGFSILYLRNITITSEAGVQSIFSDENAEDIIFGGVGMLSILSVKGGEYNVYGIDGKLITTLNIAAGEGRVISVEKGIYVVAGKKLLVK